MSNILSRPSCTTGRPTASPGVLTAGLHPELLKTKTSCLAHGECLLTRILAVVTARYIWSQPIYIVTNLLVSVVTVL